MCYFYFYSLWHIHALDCCYADIDSDNCFALPELGIRITAFERLLGTISGEVPLDRIAQRQGAMVMIQERPWTGWGLASQIQGKALNITELGAHNGYLTLIMYMGLPLGITFIVVIIHGVIKRLKLLRLKDNALNYHIAVILCILFGANQEDYLVGVNQISTNLFLFHLWLLVSIVII